MYRSVSRRWKTRIVRFVRPPARVRVILLCVPLRTLKTCYADKNNRGTTLARRLQWPATYFDAPRSIKRLSIPPSRPHVGHARVRSVRTHLLSGVRQYCQSSAAAGHGPLCAARPYLTLIHTGTVVRTMKPAEQSGAAVFIDTYASRPR